MPRYETTQRRKAQKALERRWELPPGSHVWLYVRHSPGDNQTIDSQVQAMKAWCEAQGWIVDRIFIDAGVEGSREDREQFQLMISLARQPDQQVDGIAVWSFSRFARSMLDAQFYKADLRKRGYVIVSKTDDIPNNEMAPLIEAFHDWKNQRFLEDMSADIKRGQSYVVEQGYWSGGHVPRGYRVEHEVFGRKRNGDARYGGRLVKDEALADRVALAWRMKLEENASYEAIHEATRLYSNRQHYSTFFSNFIYAGIFVYHGKRFPEQWEQGATFCEPYVTLDEFMRIQANRQKRTFQAVNPRVLGSAFLLSGLVVCGHCLAKGQRVTVTARVDKRRPDTSWYICGVKLRQRGPDCDLPRVPCWLLEESIVQSLLADALTPTYLAQEVMTAQQMLDERRPHLEHEIARLEQETVQKESAVRELLRLIQKQGLSPILESEYQSANVAWTMAMAQLAALRKEAASSGTSDVGHAEIEAYLNDVRQVLKHGEIHVRQALLRRFVKQIVLYPNHATLEYTFGLSALTPLPGFGGVDSPSDGVPTVAPAKDLSYFYSSKAA